MEPNLRVKLTCDMMVESDWKLAGSIVTLPKSRAKSLIERGHAVEAGLIERAGSVAGAAIDRKKTK